MRDNLSPELAKKTVAGIALIGRTGAAGFALRYSDDQTPLVWIAVAEYRSRGTVRHEAAGALTPDDAVLRLLDELLDGGKCVHCGKISGFSPDAVELPAEMSFGQVCWTQWDPELSTFRRGCAGGQS